MFVFLFFYLSNIAKWVCSLLVCISDMANQVCVSCDNMDLLVYLSNMTKWICLFIYLIWQNGYFCIHGLAREKSPLGAVSFTTPICLHNHRNHGDDVYEPNKLFQVSNTSYQTPNLPNMSLSPFITRLCCFDTFSRPHNALALNNDECQASYNKI